jgi:AcrR family transcriptional regulator
MAYRQTKAVEARLLDNRARILRVARDLVSEGGWSAAVIANVAAAADIATGTVYRYFASKSELYSEVLSKVSQREVDVLREIASTAAESPLERLHAAVSTFVRRALLNPRLAYALIVEPCEPAIDEVRLKYRAAVSEVILSIIVEGQAQHVLRRDIPADVAATVIVGGFLEGLVGPLSPANTDARENGGRRKEATVLLAQQIATLACSSMLLPRPVVRHLTRSLS